MFGFDSDTGGSSRLELDERAQLGDLLLECGLLEQVRGLDQLPR
jgi:hypothetical protein